MPPPSLVRRNKVPRRRARINLVLIVQIGVVLVVVALILLHLTLAKSTTTTTTTTTSGIDVPTSPVKQAPPSSRVVRAKEEPSSSTEIVGEDAGSTNEALPPGLQSVLTRAKHMRGICNSIHDNPESDLNEIDVPSFGLIDDFEAYKPSSPEETTEWQCKVPPSTACHVQKFTVIFLGFNPDRLLDIKRQMKLMLKSSEYSSMIEEIVLVWNNPESIQTKPLGKEIYNWSVLPHTPMMAQDSPNRFRIFFPLEHGLDSSLMNRYHPMIKPKSEAILYYDDDGPFYPVRAIHSAFELWKRNSDAQLGAMCRAFILSPRQAEEKKQVLGDAKLHDRKWISHCRDHGDEIKYDYRYFTMFHANMVLPSGSFLHRDYLCFIWHPAFTNLRSFVFKHVVHPDDMTVSTIVSHVSGRAPLTYSRRLPAPEQRRRLGEEISVNGTSPQGMWRTRDWGKLRSIALNSVISYFGGINSGSFGWCYKTEYHKIARDGRHVCDPDIARQGMLPWLNKGGHQNDVCPS